MSIKRTPVTAEAAPEEVDRLDADEILFIVGNDDAVVRFSDSGNDRIERAARLALGLALSHEARPNQGGGLVEGKHAAGEKSLRSFRPAKPRLKLIAPFAGGFLQHAATDLCEGQ